MHADQLMKTSNSDKGKRMLRVLAENGLFGPARVISYREGIEYDASKTCYLCSLEGACIFERIPDLIDRVLKELEGIEFTTFLVGSIQSPLLDERQDEIRSELGLSHGESLKADFNRELGKFLQSYLQRKVEFEAPEVVIVYDVVNDSISLQINPLFIYGRYLKQERGIPQSRWDCSDCKGKGCEVCNNTGRKYPDSISEYIGGPFLQTTKGSRYKVHAAGREDIDALMLGTGRPFVIEISEPQRRTLDFESIIEKIKKESEGKVEVLDLSVTTRAHGQRLKEEAAENIKEYTAIISTEGEVSDEFLRVAEQGLANITIQQRTPERVAHRRSDLTREKRVIEVRLKHKKDKLVEGYFKVQGGTYIKELISGDNGRTSPSLTELLHTMCKCIELDVVAIHSTHHKA
jgi:tRNA pseudouridine synthase 10